MNKLFKCIGFTLLLVMVVFGVQTVRAAKDSADPAQLPYKLNAEDTMATIEQKLGAPKVEHALQAGWEAGEPDFGGAFDYAHYWAVYKRFGVVVIYNTPTLADKNATIYKILVLP